MKEAALHRIEYLPEQIYFAARDGMAISLCSLLETMNQEKLKELLETVSRLYYLFMFCSLSVRKSINFTYG